MHAVPAVPCALGPLRSGSDPGTCAALQPAPGQPAAAALRGAGGTAALETAFLPFLPASHVGQAAPFFSTIPGGILPSQSQAAKNDLKPP